MEWYHYILVVAVGIVAGIINTLAAGGSLLTLPVLMALGLPPNMANGTNRIAILLQNVVGVGRFHKEKVMDFPSGFKVGLPAALGAIAGAFIAVNLNDEAANRAFTASSPANILCPMNDVFSGEPSPQHPRVQA